MSAIVRHRLIVKVVPILSRSELKLSMEDMELNFCFAL